MDENRQAWNRYQQVFEGSRSKPTLTPRELIVSRQLSSSTPLEVHSHASSEPPLTSARAGREKHAFVS